MSAIKKEKITNVPQSTQTLAIYGQKFPSAGSLFKELVSFPNRCSLSYVAAKLSSSYIQGPPERGQQTIVRLLSSGPHPERYALRLGGRQAACMPQSLRRVSVHGGAATRNGAAVAFRAWPPSVFAKYAPCARVHDWAGRLGRSRGAWPDVARDLALAHGRTATPAGVRRGSRARRALRGSA